MSKRKKSHTQYLRDRLEDAIINGRLKPGDRIDTEALSRQYGVSRTPIREAIHQLSASGLVRVEPKRGTFVAELGLARLIEMFEVMSELEGMCGRLAAKRINDDEAKALKKALESCREEAASGNTDSYYYCNERFHHLIYEMSHNSYLASEAGSLHDRLKPYRRLQLRMRNRVSRSFSEHEEIVDAILAGNSERAEQRLKAHIQIQGERFTDFVSSLKAMNQEDAPAWANAI